MYNKKLYKISACLWVSLICSISVFAQADATSAGSAPAAPHLNPAFFLLVTVAVIFALLIAILGYVLVAVSGIYLKKPLDGSGGSGKAKTVLISALLLGISRTMYAQEPAATAAVPTASNIAGMTPTAFFLLVLTIFIETVVVLVLLWNISNLIKKNAEAKGEKTKSQFNWWAIAIAAFLIFNAVYIWKFSGPEPEPATQTAKVAEEVNDSNVKVLTDQTDISAGKDIFVKSCAVCHGNDGGGIIGPNLTDNYWLHGGDIKSVFKTIHDGINAMPPWKATYSGKEIEQVASFVESLKGTKPANPKAPEGKEE